MTIKRTLLISILSFIILGLYAQTLENELNQQIAGIESSCNKRIAELNERISSLEKRLFEEQQELQIALSKYHPSSNQLYNSLEPLYKSIDITQGELRSCKEELNSMNAFKEERINKARNLYNSLKKIQDDLAKQENEKARQASDNAKKQAAEQERLTRLKEEQERRRQYEEELEEQRKAFLQKMEEQRKAYGNAVRTDIRAKNESRLSQELAAIDKRAHEGSELLEQISTPSRNQYLLENGLADRVFAGYDAKENVYVDQTSIRLNNQLTFGRLSVEEHIQEDIKGFIKKHLTNDFQHPFSEWSFCQEMIEKVCSYYKIDKQKLLMGLCEPEIKNAIISSLNRYSLTANEQMKALLDRWGTRRNIPQWSILQNGRSSKQMLSLVNIMTVTNKNYLPVPVGSDEKYLYYSLNNTNKIARIERKTSKMEITDGDIGYILQQSLSNYALSDESKTPTYQISSVFREKRNLRRYEILEDGSGKEKYTDELGKTINYNVKPPVLHYMSDSSIVVYNAFSLTEKTPTIRKDEDKITWGYKFAYKNLSFSPKYDFSTNNNNESESKGKISGGINVDGIGISESKDSKGSISKGVNIREPIGLITGKLSASTSENSNGNVSNNMIIGGEYGLVSGEFSASNNSRGETSADISASVEKYGTGITVSAGIAGSKNENGSIDREVHGSMNLSLLGVVSREYNISFSDNYLRIHEGSNVGYRQLPSSIQGVLLNDLFAEDEKKSTLYFYDRYTSDDENPQKMPITKEEFLDIKNRALNDIKHQNIPDYQYKSCEFNSFGSCLEDMR